MTTIETHVDENMNTKFDAIRRIGRSLEEIPQLTDLGSGSPDFIKWRRNTSVAISNTFGNDSQHKRDFDQIGYDPVVFFSNMSSSDYTKPYQGGLINAKALLESMLEEIEEYWSDDPAPRPASEIREISQQQVTNRVFVVHGRDDGAKNTVARFLESFDLEAVILHEQPNEGRTIVEKFEDYSDVGFAVVLCTPDDVGGLAMERENLRHRPRQNVVMELGFFLAKLGRNKVCPLVKGDLEMPSDYDGVLYVQMEGTEDWRTKLAIELKGAGLPVDLNRLAR